MIELAAIDLNSTDKSEPTYNNWRPTRDTHLHIRDRVFFKVSTLRDTSFPNSLFIKKNGS